MGGWVDEWVDEWMNGWMDGWMNGWVDGWMNGRMDGWKQGKKGGREDCYSLESLEEVEACVAKALKSLLSSPTPKPLFLSFPLYHPALTPPCSIPVGSLISFL